MYGLIKEFLDYIICEKGFSLATLDAYKRDLHFLVESLRQDDITDWTQVKLDHIRNFARKQMAKGLRDTTVARRLMSTKSFFKFLRRERFITHNPCQYLGRRKIWQRAPTILTYEQVMKMLDCVDTSTIMGKRDLAILELLYASGVRASEACGLNMQDLVLESSPNLIKVMGKGRKERMTPLGRPAVNAIMAYRNSLDQKRRKLAPMFLSVLGFRINRATVWEVVKRHANKAGIWTRVSPHILRHSMATHMLLRGADIRVLQELLGHQDISTTGKYLQVDMRHLQEALNKAHPRARMGEIK